MKKMFHSLLWLLRGVRVYALVGKSGTGKSFRAQLVAEKYGIELIVDDGLLIRDQKIIAGRSAKREKGYLGAVRTAIFDDPNHRREVMEALSRQKFKGVLVIATSDRMALKIIERLELRQPKKIIHIEDIASEEEIEIAQRARNMEGKHVIPVPSIEVRRNYPSIFYDSVKVFLKNRLSNRPRVYEKAVVRPEFAKRGRISISETALTQMILHCVNEFNAELTVTKVTVKLERSGYKVGIVLDVPYGTQLSGNIHTLQQYVVKSIEKFTGIIIDGLDVAVETISEKQR
jgi:adenylate kinase family enzyme